MTLKITKTWKSAGATASLCYLVFLPGCGAADPGQAEADQPAVPQSTEQVSKVSQAVETPAQCGTDLTTCTQNAKNIFDLLGCNATWATCLAGNLIPPVVNTTVNAVDACRTTLTTCADSAQTPAALAQCQVAAVGCTATAFGTPLAETAAAAVDCVDSAAACVGNASSAAAVATCGQTFASCATEAASALLPPAVTTALNGVNSCTSTLGTCVQAATTPAAVTECNVTEVTCVGGTLGVNIPNPSAAITCAQNAASCVAAARSVADLNQCTSTLTACVQEAVPLPPVDCATAFTQCFAQNPFNLFQCADTARKCEQGTP